MVAVDVVVCTLSERSTTIVPDALGNRPVPAVILWVSTSGGRQHTRAGHGGEDLVAVGGGPDGRSGPHGRRRVHGESAGQGEAAEMRGSSRPCKEPPGAVSLLLASSSPRNGSC